MARDFVLNYTTIIQTDLCIVIAFISNKNVDILIALNFASDIYDMPP